MGRLIPFSTEPLQPHQKYMAVHVALIIVLIGFLLFGYGAFSSTLFDDAPPLATPAQKTQSSSSQPQLFQNPFDAEQTTNTQNMPASIESSSPQPPPSQEVVPSIPLAPAPTLLLDNLGIEQNETEEVEEVEQPQLMLAQTNATQPTPVVPSPDDELPPPLPQI